MKKVDTQHPEKLHELQNHLPFLSERMKLKNVEKLVANLHEKTEYAHKKFKTSLKSWTDFEKGSQSD